MTTPEFSTEFDVFYNNITSNQAPGLNLYEKSVFLTKAQSQLMSEYFSKQLGGSEGGFDGSPKRQIDFSSLMEWTTLERITQNVPKFDPRSILYAMPDDALFIVDEQLSLLDYDNQSSQADEDIFYSVVPISYEEYAKLMAKPYKYPPKSQAWRLITKKDVIAASVYTTYTTVHTQMNVYATMGTAAKLIFTLEYDSNPNNSDVVNIAIVTKGFDSSAIADSLILEIEDMTVPLEEALKMLFQDTGINNLKWDIEPEYINMPCKAIWEDTIIMLATNNGSIATVHESKEKSVQLLEIIGRFNSTPYYRMRYIRRPNPIILEPRLDLLGVSIEGIGVNDGNTYSTTNTTIRECELPEEMHHEILERAVTLAKISWQGSTMTQTALAVQAGK